MNEQIFRAEDVNGNTESDRLLKGALETMEACGDAAAQPNSPFRDWGEGPAEDEWLHPELSLMVPVGLEVHKDALESDQLDETPRGDFASSGKQHIGLSPEFWKGLMLSGIKSLSTGSPNDMIKYDIDSLIGWALGSGEKDDPMVSMLNDITAKLDVIKEQLDQVLNKLNTLIDEAEAKNYRDDIAEASLIRDPLQNEINNLTVELENAGENEELRKKIINAINTKTIGGNSFYQQTISMGDTIIRTMNRSQKDIFHIAESFTKLSHFLWDHQAVIMYINLVSYYFNTYIQAMAYSRLSLLHQLKLSEDDPYVHNNYLSLYQTMFTGNEKAFVTSIASKVNKAFNSSPNDMKNWENPHYAVFKPGKDKTYYVMRNTTFMLDSAPKTVSVEEVQKIRNQRGTSQLAGVLAYVFDQYEAVQKCGFKGIIDTDLYLPYANPLFRYLNGAPQFSFLKFFGEMAGLEVKEEGPYKNFSELAAFPTQPKAPNTYHFHCNRSTGSKTIMGGNMTLIPSPDNDAFYQAVFSKDMRPMMIISTTKPRA